jgi:heme oxygenase
MTTAPSIMTRLKDSTWPQHQHAEGRPLEQALIQGRLPRELFVRYLEQRLLLHEPLERHLLALRHSDPRLTPILLDELLQSDNLRRDLAALGSSATRIRPCAATQKLVASFARIASDQPIANLGAYYVFEGSKNGARFIARAIAGAYRLAPGPGLLYLDPHSERQRPLWASFKAAMDATAFEATEADAMVAAAQHTFECISELDDELYAGQAQSCPAHI